MTETPNTNDLIRDLVDTIDSPLSRTVEIDPFELGALFHTDVVHNSRRIFVGVETALQYDDSVNWCINYYVLDANDDIDESHPEPVTINTLRTDVIAAIVRQMVASVPDDISVG
jgi:hypothetical protein